MIAFVLFLLLSSSAYATIFWQECKSKADHPPVAEGNFYNLCIVNHEFRDESFTWQFALADIKETSFIGCTFSNFRDKNNNFTLTFWDEVTFDSCLFEGFTEANSPMLFNKMSMRNVEFKNTVFDKSVTLLFDEFDFQNVTFDGCTFMGETVFERGAMKGVVFKDSKVMRSVENPLITSADSFIFLSLTITGMELLQNIFVHPVRFESVNAADVVVRQTMFNQFHCHSEPDFQTGRIKRLSQFNDTIFEAVEFMDTMLCDRTTWRGFVMEDVIFWDNAIFSKSKIDSIIWNHVSVTSSTRDCHELNFSDTTITEKIFANVSTHCKAFFEGAQFERVRIDNLNFTTSSSSFCRAKFVEQEFVDEQCCTKFCQRSGCDCEISQPSGICPLKINETDDGVCSGDEEGVCFPADATVRRGDGTVVSMEQLALRERIAIGNGEFSDVFFFGHRVPNVSSKFVTISHSASRTPLRLSKQHYLYVNGQLATANSVKVGDRLRAENGEDAVIVRSVTLERGRGLYAPASMHGDLVVDGVVVSSYTRVLHPRISHLLLLPLRLLYRLGFGSFDGLHRNSWEPFVRMLGLRRGPEVMNV